MGLPISESDFSDPDGDTLTFSVSSDRDDIFQEGDAQTYPFWNKSLGRLFVRHKHNCDLAALRPLLESPHDTVVTVTATDPGGLTASASLTFALGDWIGGCTNEPQRGAVVDEDDGTVVRLTFSENLTNLSESALDDLRYRFAIQGVYWQGTEVRNLSPDSVAISGATVTLTLGAPVHVGGQVTVGYSGGASGLQFASGGQVGTFTARATRPGSAVAPLPVAAQVEGTTLTLTFDQDLDAGSAPAGSRFAVRFSDGKRQGTGTAAVSGRRVAVTLSSAVPADRQGRRTLKVWYVPDNDANPLRGASSGPLVGSIWGFRADELGAAAPALSSAVVAGTKLTLYYGEALDTGSTPATGDFTVTAAGSGATVNGVAVSETAVTLTLASSVASGAAVTVGYTAGTNPIRDVAGTNAANLSSQSVTNKGPDDPGAPARHWTDPATGEGWVLTLTFNREIDPAHVPAPSAFTLSDPWVSVKSVTVRGTKVELGLTDWLGPCNGRFSINYAKPATDALRNLWGTEVAEFTKQDVKYGGTNTCVGWDNSWTGSVVMRANRPFDTDETPQPGWFTVTASGGPVTVTGAAFDPDDPHLVVLTVSRDFAADETIAVSYTRPPGEHGLWDVDGNQLADVTDLSVENRAGQAAGAPAVSGVALVSDPGDDATYAAGDTMRVEVTFSEAVEVDTTNGTPRLKLDLGGDDGAGERWAAYEDGSGTETLTFAWTAAAPDEAAVGVAVLADTLELNGGTITSAATGTDVALAHAGLDPDPAHRVDAAPPRLVRGEIDGGTMTLWFSEALDPDATGGRFNMGVQTSETTSHGFRATGDVSVAGNVVTVGLGAGNPRAKAGLHGRNRVSYYRRAAPGAG